MDVLWVHFLKISNKYNNEPYNEAAYIMYNIIILLVSA